MKKIYILLILVISLFTISACDDILDTKGDIYLTPEMLETQYEQMFSFGYKTYTNVINGFTRIDNNLLAAVSDEAQNVTPSSDTQRFNEGSWNAFYNPDDYYAKAYRGIHDVNFYLENSTEYKKILALNRDTMNATSLTQYKKDVQNCAWLRCEAQALRAYYYFELAKRYGGVPLITKTYNLDENANKSRASFDEVINAIVQDIDEVKDNLVEDWKSEGYSDMDGRLTKGAALSIKARALLYAASPLFNPENNKEKWERAAAASHDIIAMNRYKLHTSYKTLFTTKITNTSKETIWAIRMGQTNDFERANYPVGTPGGGTGICPSQNLVSEYEYKTAPSEDNPYEGLDPRFEFTIVHNGSTWNGRTIEIWEGGQDDPKKANASKTGYYLRKFLNENQNLVNDAKEIRSWIIFRYAETLLNYAEAMNEAYGPDSDPKGYGKTAREAVNEVRNRSGVRMPPVSVSIGDVESMREAIKHERCIELAFEEHRYWDLKRWNDAKEILNQPIKGVKVTKLSEGENIRYVYTEFDVAKRFFSAPKMNLYPIPQTEIVKSQGVLVQNPEW